MESTGEEITLQEYGVFGKEIIAPGDGVIAQVVDGSFDCEPGEADRSVGVGNMVMVDHQNGEFSLICHFKYQSILVKVGDTDKQADLLGLCGNMGNTSQPHIHFNLQDALRGYKANALPAQFVKIVVDGEVKEEYEPIRFQWVSNI
jgi:murein DD-endopeptidase MepM/ murein hydrolase activator NlpD